MCAVFVDVGFATSDDFTSQRGFSMVFMDKHRCTNIIHYGSIKSKRVARSVLSAELFAMVHGFDFASTICATVRKVLRRVVPLPVYNDSKSLHDFLSKLPSISENCLLNDLSLL